MCASRCKYTDNDWTNTRQNESEEILLWGIYLCPQATHHLLATSSFSPYLCVGFLFLILYPAASSSAPSSPPPSFTHHLCQPPSFTHHLSHTIFHTELCQPPSFPHHLSHPTLSHHLSHTTLWHIIFHTTLITHIPVWISSRISRGSTPLRRTDFLARKFFDFDERLLLSTPSFSTEQFLETSESGDPDFLGSLSAQNPGA